MSANSNAKPHRPCTEYNLFSQLERAYILQVHLHADPALAPRETFNPSQPSYAGLPPLPARYADLVLSYDWFLPGKEQRRQRKHRKSHGLIGFHQLSARISAAWKSLDDPEIRTFCATVHEADARRYRAEMDAWKRRQKEAFRLESSSFAANPQGFGEATFPGQEWVSGNLLQANALLGGVARAASVASPASDATKQDTNPLPTAQWASDRANALIRESNALLRGVASTASAASPASDATKQDANPLSAARWASDTMQYVNGGLSATSAVKNGVPETNPVSTLPTRSVSPGFARLRPYGASTDAAFGLTPVQYSQAMLSTSHTRTPTEEETRAMLAAIDEKMGSLPETSSGMTSPSPSALSSSQHSQMMLSTHAADKKMGSPPAAGSGKASPSGKTSPSLSVLSSVDIGDDEIMRMWKKHCGPNGTSSRASSTTFAAGSGTSGSSSADVQHNAAFGASGSAGTMPTVQQMKAQLDRHRKELEAVELKLRTENARSA